MRALFIRAKRWAVLLAWALSGPFWGRAAVYSLEDLGPFVDIGAEETRPNAVGPDGAVVGANALQGYYRAFLYDGAMRGLGTLGGGESFAADINAGGVIVGYSHTASAHLHAFLWTEGGTDGIPTNPEMRDLGTFGGNESGAFGINDLGQVTGYAQTNKRDHAFVYQDGTMTDIGTAVGSQLHSYGFGINEAGHVAGAAYGAGGDTSSAFLYDGQSAIFLGTLGGAGSFAYDLNDRDEVAGYSGLADGVRVHAFRYVSGAMEDLGTLGGDYSYGLAINSAGEIVGGSFTDRQNLVYHAFIWRGGTMEDLNSMLDGSGDGWVLIEARAINDRGQIAGVGSAYGGERGFLLTPALPAEAPRITEWVVVDNDVRLRFTTMPGATYALESAWEPTSKDWSTVVPDILGTGGEVAVTDQGGAAQGQQFYRVSLTNR